MGAARRCDRRGPRVGEFALIDRHFRRAPCDAAVRVGIGDDAAVIAPTPGTELVLSVDMLVEGRHFSAGTDPARLGHKTLAVNLSDLAAMGAQPRFALLAGALPEDDDAWLAAFMAGFRALAERFDAELIGGDTTRGPRNLCVTIVGEVPAGTAVTRAGARAGDDVYVSGALGDAALALAALEHRTALAPAALDAARARLELPEPRVALGMALRGVATSALDVSDGLAGDLAHMLARSQVGADARTGGDPALAGARREDGRPGTGARPRVPFGRRRRLRALLQRAAHRPRADRRHRSRAGAAAGADRCHRRRQRARRPRRARRAAARASACVRSLRAMTRPPQTTAGGRARDAAP